jgi:hypothetical protein
MFSDPVAPWLPDRADAFLKRDDNGSGVSGGRPDGGTLWGGFAAQACSLLRRHQQRDRHEQISRTNSSVRHGRVRSSGLNLNKRQLSQATYSVAEGPLTAGQAPLGTYSPPSLRN